jgi:hypothetical protein
MATYTPPPYFPQSSLAPPDEKRYRKFKLIVAVICVILLGALGVASLAVWYLVKFIF